MRKAIVVVMLVMVVGLSSCSAKQSMELNQTNTKENSLDEIKEVIQLFSESFDSQEFNNDELFDNVYTKHYEDLNKDEYVVEDILELDIANYFFRYSYDNHTLVNDAITFLPDIYVEGEEFVKASTNTTYKVFTNENYIYMEQTSLDNTEEGKDDYIMIFRTSFDEDKLIMDFAAVSYVNGYQFVNYVSYDSEYGLHKYQNIAYGYEGLTISYSELHYDFSDNIIEHSQFILDEKDDVYTPSKVSYTMFDLNEQTAQRKIQDKSGKGFEVGILKDNAVSINIVEYQMKNISGNSFGAPMYYSLYSIADIEGWTSVKDGMLLDVLGNPIVTASADVPFDIPRTNMYFLQSIYDSKPTETEFNNPKSLAYNGGNYKKLMDLLDDAEKFDDDNYLDESTIVMNGMTYNFDKEQGNIIIDLMPTEMKNRIEELRK